MKKITYVCILGLFAFASCKKSKLNKATTSFEDSATAEVAYNDMLSVTEAALSDSSLKKSPVSFNSVYGMCANVTITPPAGDPTFPKTLEIDFGTGCEGDDGITRSGKITATITGKYRDEGSVTTITSDDYLAKGYTVNGTKTVTNKGTNADGNIYYTIEIEGSVNTPEGDELTYKSSREREWIEGEDTPFNPFDDTYSITGTANGINREGRAYTHTITSPLIVKLDCRWIKQGTVEVQPEDLKLRTVDFGDGTCDNDATVTIGKKTYDVEMK